MYPVLLKIPLFGLFGYDSFPIHGYGVMVALGFIVASLIVQRNAVREGEDPKLAIDLVFYILIAAILGSRILHIIVAERDLFFKNPRSLLAIWRGGLVFYGGFIASVLVSLLFFRRHRLPALKYCDFFAPAIALGHSIGRIGCYLAGCCHGRPMLTKTWYAFVTEDPLSLAPKGIPLYPTQALESLAEFCIFLFLSFRLKRKRFDGEVISLYLIIYAAARFSIEFFRGDAERGFVFGSSLSTSQLIAMILFAIGLLLYLYRFRIGRKTA